jgi:hypothetical protein
MAASEELGIHQVLKAMAGPTGFEPDSPTDPFDRGRFVLDLNRAALVELAGPKHLAVVPGATHLFEEPGTLEQVARLASDLFQRYLVDRG